MLYCAKKDGFDVRGRENVKIKREGRKEGRKEGREDERLNYMILI